jgi:hypothetical protein
MKDKKPDTRYGIPGITRMRRKLNALKKKISCRYIDKPEEPEATIKKDPKSYR